MTEALQIYVSGVMDEIAQVVGAAPTVTINLMVGRLTEAYAIAEGQGDQQSMGLIASVYEKVTALEQGVIGAVELAAAARAAAVELVGQRDEAVGALEAKVKAMQELDLNDRDVAQVEQLVVENIYSDGYSIVGDPASIIYNDVGIRCDYGSGGTFFTLLTDREMYEDLEDDAVAEGLKQELAAFIDQFVAKYESAIEG